MACDAEVCGFQMLNNYEIVTSMQEGSDPVDNETEKDEDNNNESSEGPSNADSFSALVTAMEWYEQHSECCSTQLLLLKRIRDLAAKKRAVTRSSTRTNPSDNPRMEVIKTLRLNRQNLPLGHTEVAVKTENQTSHALNGDAADC
ncbi:hypothetical protein TNCV_973251 [Trichonephila clavipes]|nr:hypothetical protein TNCV_973251 [Trichonephila clavipes]